MFTPYHLLQARDWARQEGYLLVKSNRIQQLRSTAMVDPFAARQLAHPAFVSDYLTRRQDAEIAAQLRKDGALFVGESTDPDSRFKRVEAVLTVLLPGAFD